MTTLHELMVVAAMEFKLTARNGYHSHGDARLTGEPFGLHIRDNDEFYGRAHGGTFAISAEWAEPLRKHGGYNDPRRVIRVSKTKPAAQIVKEIKRRLMPHLESDAAQRIERKRKAEEYKHNVERNREELQQACGGLIDKPGVHHEEGTVYLNREGVYINGRVSEDGSLSIQHGTLPKEVAVELMKAIAAYERKVQR